MQDRGPLRVVRPESAVATLSSFPVIVFAYTCHQNVSTFSRINIVGFMLTLQFNRCSQY